MPFGTKLFASPFKNSDQINSPLFAEADAIDERL
jgi:hypothetical protein